MQKNIVLLLLTLATLPTVARAQIDGGVLIDQDKGEHHLHLPRAMAQALNHFDPTFSPYRDGYYTAEIVQWYRDKRHQAPWGVVGDFNSDGHPDIALYGQGHDGAALIVLLSEETGYRAIPVQAGQPIRELPRDGQDEERKLWIYLVHRMPGHIEGVDAPPLDLKTEAFGVIYSGKCSVLYYWSQNGFISYQISD